MPKNEPVEWINIAAATFALGVEAVGVIGLRALKSASGGPTAAEEAWRMYSEKLVTLAELGGSRGTTPAETTRLAVTHYRRKVAANRRRLSKG